MFSVHWSGRLQKYSIFESKTVVTVFEMIILRLSFVLERQRLKKKNGFQFSMWNENALERGGILVLLLLVVSGGDCHSVKEEQNAEPEKKEREQNTNVHGRSAWFASPLIFFSQTLCTKSICFFLSNSFVRMGLFTF